VHLLVCELDDTCHFWIPVWRPRIARGVFRMRGMRANYPTVMCGQVFVVFPSFLQANAKSGRGVAFDHPSLSSAEIKERVELYLYFTSGTSCSVLGWTSPLPLLHLGECQYWVAYCQAFEKWWWWWWCAWFCLIIEWVCNRHYGGVIYCCFV